MTIVDTDILIDAGRSVQEAVDCLKDIRANSTLAVSVVTQLELVVGCRNKSELQKLDKFLKQFQTVKLNEAISDKSVELLRLYRLSHGLLIADSRGFTLIFREFLQVRQHLCTERVCPLCLMTRQEWGSRQTAKRGQRGSLRSGSRGVDSGHSPDPPETGGG